MATFKLSPAAKQSAGWQETRAFLEQSLAELRERNDSHMDPIQTAGIRAKIDLVKEMLKVDDEPPKYKPASGHIA